MGIGKDEIPRDMSELRESLVKGKGWSLKVEGAIWDHCDKHSQAGLVLLSENELTARMERLLNTKAIEDLRCLACHTSAPVWQAKADAGPRLAERYKAQGVDCEGCHGPSGSIQQGKETLAEGWYAEHYRKNEDEDKPPWRFRSAAEKRDQYGYVDIRSPKVQAAVCLSCHLGDVDLNRLVTHEMYAAGHPPLGGFSLDTFREQMPRHWATLEEKNEAVRREYLERTPQARLWAKPRTRLLTVGSAVALRQMARLVVGLTQAPVATGPFRVSTNWPELAAFECAACHHDLRDDSWRQQAGSRRTPGRPLLREWPVVIARLVAINHGRTSDDWSESINPLLEALNARPFGTQVDVARSAVALETWADDLANELEAAEWSEVRQEALLREFVAFGSDDLLEYETARNLLWGIDTLLAEAAPRPADRLSDDLMELRKAFVINLHASSRERPSLFDYDLPQEWYQKRVKDFGLPLRDDRGLVKLAPSVPADNDRGQPILYLAIDKVFAPIAAYDAETFRNGCRKLAERLAEIQP
jgi:hypothetical protein